MPDRTIFVSHSSRLAHVELLKKTCAALLAKSDAAVNYTLSYDHNGAIVGGDDWFRQIDRWMVECHAAVVLFSKRALYASDWVKKEVIALSWRRELDPDFKLIPVLLDGLEPDDLKRGLEGVLRIGDYSQFINVGNDPDAIAAAVDLALRSDAHFTGYLAPAGDAVGEAVEGVVTIMLEEIDRTLLDSVRTSFAARRPTWPANMHTQNARAITRHLLADGTQSLQRLIDTIDRLPTLHAERADFMHRHLGCLWVPRESASALPAVRYGARCAAMASPYEDFVAERYVERAWPLTRLTKVVRINAKTHSLEIARQEIEAAFAPAGRDVPPTVLRTMIETYSGPVVVLLPYPLNHLLDDLKRAYSGMVFVVICKDTIPPSVAAAMPAIDVSVDALAVEHQWAKLEEARLLIAKRSGLR